ncbi:hypothetical protein WG66_001566 [Moniliophthora roreri]|nr:hypothetical protein WG66_001566 [Moniliophthora roreri]
MLGAARLRDNLTFPSSTPNTLSLGSRHSHRIAQAFKFFIPFWPFTLRDVNGTGSQQLNVPYLLLHPLTPQPEAQILSHRPSSNTPRILQTRMCHGLWLYHAESPLEKGWEKKYGVIGSWFKSQGLKERSPSMVYLLGLGHTWRGSNYTEELGNCLFLLFLITQCHFLSPALPNTWNEI